MARRRTITSPFTGGGGSDDDSGGGSDSDGGGGSSSVGSVTRDRGGAGAGGGGETTAGLGSGDDDSGGGGGGGSPGGSSPPPSDVGGPSDGGGGGASPGGSTPPASDVGGPDGAAPAPDAPAQPQGSDGGNTDADAPSVTDRVTNAATDAAAAVGQFGQDAREFQRETTPVEDAGAEIRDRLGLPSERALADEANEVIGNAAGTTPREARLRARGEAITGLREGADTVTDAVPGGRDTLAGAAVVAAAAEPTPVGEALLFGTGTAGALGGSAASNPEQGEELVPESPFSQPEIDAPSDPATDRSELDVADGTDGGEIGLPDDLTTLGGADELPTPEDPAATRSELDVPTGEGRDLSTIRAAQLIGRQEGRESDPSTDRFRPDRDDELQEILSGGGTLGEVEESGEPSVEDGGRQFEDVPEDFTSRPTGVEGFEPADSGVAEPTFPETDPGTGLGSGGTQTPPLPPVGRQDTPATGDGVGQGQPTGQTPGVDVFTTPDIDIGTDFDFGVDQPTPTRPRPDFGTPTPTTNPTDTTNRFGQPDPTVTPPDQTTSETTRRRRPRFDSDTDRDEEPLFLFQTDDALFDSGISGVGDILDTDRDGLL